MRRVIFASNQMLSWKQVEKSSMQMSWMLSLTF